MKPAAEPLDPGGGRPPETRAEVESEIAAEDEQLLWPLTARLEEVASLLDRGNTVDPRYIGRGIELWSRFGAEVHARRVRRLIGLFPATAPSVDPGDRAGHRPPWSRRSEVRLDPSRVASVERFQQLVQEQGITGERMTELRALVSLYERGGYGMRDRLASVLHAFVTSERAWARFEEEFVTTSLDPTLPAEVDALVHRGLREVSAARRRVEPELRCYLAEPIPVRPPQLPAPEELCAPATASPRR